MMHVSSPRYRTRSLSRAGSQPPALKPSVPSNNDQQNALQPMHRPNNGESSIHAVDTRLTPSRHSPSVAPKSPSDCSNMSPSEPAESPTDVFLSKHSSVQSPVPSSVISPLSYSIRQVSFKIFLRLAAGVSQSFRPMGKQQALHLSRRPSRSCNSGYTANMADIPALPVDGDGNNLQAIPLGQLGQHPLRRGNYVSKAPRYPPIFEDKSRESEALRQSHAGTLIPTCHIHHPLRWPLLQRLGAS